MGRRLLALTLLIAFVAPVAEPVFAAALNPEASLPACCRSHGGHHCEMTHLPGRSGGPALQTPPCASYPIPGTPLRVAAASLDARLPISAEPIRNPAPLALSLCLARTWTTSANPKRGPPAHLS